MPLPFCPNCRCQLPHPIVSWICLRVPPVKDKAPAPDGNTASDSPFGDVFKNAGGGKMVSYDQQGTVCEHFNASETRCEKCKGTKDEEQLLVACPNCRTEIPDLEGIEARSLTLTGPSNAGKTSYIMALEHWWNQHLHKFKLMARPVMGQRRRDDFLYLKNTIYQHRKAVESTPKGSLISFTWCIQDRTGENDGCLVTFPDVSGEDLRNVRSLAANRHYHHSAGIIFLFDAARMLSAEDIGGNPPADRDPQDHFDVADAMIQDMERRFKGERRQLMREIPIAVCVNKIDLLRERSEDWERLLKDYSPQHLGYFDWATCEERSNRIRELLYRDSSGTTVTRLEHAFDNIMFFAVATIGSAEKHDLAVNPIGVEDPLLYLLLYQNYVEANSAA